jgi:ABC-2 type transport system ATP-binding protein
MMIEVQNIKVEYMIGNFANRGLKDYFIRVLKRQNVKQSFLALDDISFELERGDMLGIIGSNGAGKSTLLKVLSGVMKPTHGKITVNGNIAALLELASGFDGDLTVKENTYLRGAMLGYTRAFMDSIYDEIIEYAELGEFQEWYFSQLSSGMKSRLAFAIACMVNPEVLILDEVLSVGDGAFRQKSETTMRNILQSGVTTLFVSHSLEQIRTLCNKVLWIEHGKQIDFGDCQPICDRYEEFINGQLTL